MMTDCRKSTVVQLSSELESERKCIRRLRRERAYELQVAREQEQNKAAIAIREMAAKLQLTKEQETVLLKARHTAEIDKVVRQKDKEFKKLKKDLVKCQSDLKEETYRRGLSTSARAAFDLERLKLLQDIKELNASKRQLEDALSSATEAGKQKSLELREFQEISRNEIAKVNREANIEIKRILEELKSKDRSSMVVKGNNGGKRFFSKCQTVSHPVSTAEVVNLGTEIDCWEKNLSPIKEGVEAATCRGNSNFSMQRKLYDLEKQLKHLVFVSGGFAEKNNELTISNKELEQRIRSLIQQNKASNTEVKSAKGEIKRLKDLMNDSGISDLTSTLEDLCKQIKDYEDIINPKKKNLPKKTVRFLLSDKDQELYPVDTLKYGEHGDGRGGREEDRIDKGGGGGGEMKEMLPLSPVADVSLGEYLNPESWCIQRESLVIVIHTLEEKLKRYEENEDKLKLNLTEACDQNEELEFQILELENSADEKRSQWQKETDSLKSELSDLENRLVIQNETSNATERNVATQCDEKSLTRELLLLKRQNLFHDLTDDHKLSVRAKVGNESERREFGCSEDGLPTISINQPNNTMIVRQFSESTKASTTHLKLDFKELRQDGRVVTQDVAESGDDGRGPTAHGLEESEWISQLESLKRKLARSQNREQQMKDQLMLLEEEKNRHIRLLQGQIERLEDEDEDADCSTATNQQRASDRIGVRTMDRPSPEGLEDEDRREFFPRNGDVNNEQRVKTIKLKLDTTLHWISNSVDGFNNLTPLTGDCNLSRKLESSDTRKEQLCRQITDLERDVEVLQEVIHSNESVIYELHLEIDKLQQSEKDLHGIVSRLEIAEEQLRTHAENMAACNGDVERQLKQLKESENVLLSNLKRSRSAEFELKLKVEQITDERCACETAWKRRLSEVELGKKLLEEKNKELEDELGDRESSECILKQKLRRRERTEGCLQNELEDAKREYGAAVNYISELEYEKELLIQKLETMNLGLVAEVIRRKQEKEAMNVEMIEINCKIRVLEQNITSKETMILSLETKLFEHEADKTKLQKSNQMRFINQKSNGNTFAPGLHELQEDFKSCSCNACSSRDLHYSEDGSCVNDGQPLYDLMSEDFISSQEMALDEVESADEASEIIDEDDGVYFSPEGSSSSSSGGQLPDEHCLAASFSDRCNRQTGSPALDSVCDSGMESLGQDLSRPDPCLEYSVCKDPPLLIYKPNPYRCRLQSLKTKTLIPVSIRYLTKSRSDVPANS